MTTISRTNGASRPAIRGALTALVTPFTSDGAVDEAAFRQLVRWQVLAGIDGLVPVGTTGEAPTLSELERDRLIAITVETVAERPSRRRVAIVAGTGTNDTAATIRATRRAAGLGADAALVVAPYYNRPDQRMLAAHFRAIADDGAPPDRRLQRPVADGYEPGRRNVPSTGRAPARRRDQGGVGTARADRADLPRAPARCRGPRRRRRMDPADPRSRWRRRHLGRIERDPGRDGDALLRRAGRRLGRGEAPCTNAGCRSSSRTSVAARTRFRRKRPSR